MSTAAVIDLERGVGITAKMRECRDVMKGIHGDRYGSLVMGMKGILRYEMRERGGGPLEAALRVLKDPDMPAATAITHAVIISAVVDMIEQQK